MLYEYICTVIQLNVRPKVKILVNFIHTVPAKSQLPHVVEGLSHAGIVHTIGLSYDIGIHARALEAKLKRLTLVLRHRICP